ncbi:MAG: hypothetical protein ACYTAF_02825, partial [Planctomycetota bacterium]
MESLFGGDASLPQTVLTLLLGLVFCFCGYPICRTFLRVYGLLLGLLIGLIIGSLTESAAAALLGGALGALLGLFLIPLFYFVGLFLTGGLAGGLLLALVVSVFPTGSAVPQIGAALAGFVLGGILGVRYEKSVMVLLTSIYGIVVAGTGLNGIGLEWLHLGATGARADAPFA